MKRVFAAAMSAIMCCFCITGNGAVGAEKCPSRFRATFIQNWCCRDWTQQRWEQELGSAKQAGFDSVIIQSVYDIVRGECPQGENTQDPDAYSSAESFCMFCSENTATYHSSQNGGDELSVALEAAKATGMKLWLGTVSDDMWWKYGWGVPDGSFFADWSEENGRLGANLITEMWSRYGSSYSQQIAGWYYVNEIWNMDAACREDDNGEYVRIIGSNIKASVSAVQESCPEKPLLISPFYNPDISGPEQYTAFLSDIIEAGGLRQQDIYAGQDGGGKEYSPVVIRQWAEAQKKAVDGIMTFWINNECFGTEMTAKPVSVLRENYLATADLADGNILFSWDHYYAPDEELNRQFRKFTFESVRGDVNGDGRFNVADLAVMQSFLLGRAELAVPSEGDLCADGTVDVFDMVSMRKMLIAQEW